MTVVEARLMGRLDDLADVGRVERREGEVVEQEQLNPDERR